MHSVLNLLSSASSSISPEGLHVAVTKAGVEGELAVTLGDTLAPVPDDPEPPHATRSDVARTHAIFSIIIHLAVGSPKSTTLPPDGMAGRSDRFLAWDGKEFRAGSSWGGFRPSPPVSRANAGNTSGAKR